MNREELATRLDAAAARMPASLESEVEVARLEAQLLVLEAALRSWRPDAGQQPLDVLLDELVAAEGAQTALGEVVVALASTIDQVEYEGFEALGDGVSTDLQAQLAGLVEGLQGLSALLRGPEAAG